MLAKIQILTFEENYIATGADGRYHKFVKLPYTQQIWSSAEAKKKKTFQT